MEKLKKIVDLLGEDNVRRLQNEITDILIEGVQDEIETSSNYIIDYEFLLDTIREEIEEDIKAKIIARYTKKLDRKLDELFQDGFRSLV